MTLEEAIEHYKAAAEGWDELCKRYDDASGYSRSHNEAIRTTDAKRCEECAEEHRQLAEWLRELKQLKEQKFYVTTRKLSDDELKHLEEQMEKERWQFISVKQDPCDDAISRQAAIDAMAKIEHDDIAQYGCAIPEGFDSSPAIEALNDLPSVTPQPKMGRWIPVSKRLPEDRREVLVTAYWHETYQVMMASYFGDGLWWCVPFNNCGEHMQRLKPKAWMPLPTPYRMEVVE